jgi:hypothetical protein
MEKPAFCLCLTPGSHGGTSAGYRAENPQERTPSAGHACLSGLVQGTVCKILDAEAVKPHKVRYYLERRDPDFAEKMAEVLCVYRRIRLLKKKPPSDAVAIVSYDEKPGVQASVGRPLATLARPASDLRPRS